MKCMDCISVCPNDALYLRIGKPTVAVSKSKAIPRNYSLTWPEEILGALVFLGSFLGVRSVYGLVPFPDGAGVCGDHDLSRPENMEIAHGEGRLFSPLQPEVCRANAKSGMGLPRRRDPLARFNAQRLDSQRTGVTLAIPVPELRAVLDATPSEHLTFLVAATGKPYGGSSFSEQFRNWCDAAGLPARCKPHGLRKAACRRLAEAGCSANEIMAISGHTTMKKIVRYTVAADQARLARNAVTRMRSANEG